MEFLAKGSWGEGDIQAWWCHPGDQNEPCLLLVKYQKHPSQNMKVPISQFENQGPNSNISKNQGCSRKDQRVARAVYFDGIF